MIHVVADIELKPGIREEYLKIFKANVPAVKAEDGCIAYAPTVDIDSGLEPQEEISENRVTVVEAWQSLDALYAHLQAPHMLDYKEKVKDMVTGVSLKITEDV